MKDTAIEWCDHTWSPWRGCTKVSPGCAHCYAESLSKRNPSVLGEWGKGKPRVLAKNWNYPVKWNQTKVCESKGCAHVEFRRPRVFPSLCDWLDEEVSGSWLARFLDIIQRTPNLDWLLLTKRPKLWQSRITAEQSVFSDAALVTSLVDRWLSGKPPPNVWIGTSVEDQTRADERIPEFLRIPAKLRFLSVEPMLGPVNIMRWVSRTKCPECGGDTVPRSGVGFDHERRCLEHGAFDPDERVCIDWVIVGGESGPGARPCNVAWIRDIVRQCRSAGVPVFVKQLGAKAYEEDFAHTKECWNEDCQLSGGPEDCTGAVEREYFTLTHPKGGDPSEWPEDLRVRQMPEVKL